MKRQLCLHVTSTNINFQNNCMQWRGLGEKGRNKGDSNLVCITVWKGSIKVITNTCACWIQLSPLWNIIFYMLWPNIISYTSYNKKSRNRKTASTIQVVLFRNGNNLFKKKKKKTCVKSKEKLCKLVHLNNFNIVFMQKHEISTTARQEING